MNLVPFVLNSFHDEPVAKPDYWRGWGDSKGVVEVRHTFGYSEAGARTLVFELRDGDKMKFEASPAMADDAIYARAMRTAVFRKLYPQQ